MRSILMASTVARGDDRRRSWKVLLSDIGLSLCTGHLGPGYIALSMSNSHRMIRMTRKTVEDLNQAVCC